MITAIIRNKENTLVLELPHSIYDIYEKLQSITELMNEKQRLTVQLEQYAAMRQKRESAKSRLDEIYTILDGLQNHPMEYDDKLVRQIIECIVVESKEKIKVVFIGGTEIEMVL